MTVTHFFFNNWKKKVHCIVKKSGKKRKSDKKEEEKKDDDGCMCLSVPVNNLLKEDHEADGERVEEKDDEAVEEALGALDGKAEHG